MIPSVKKSLQEITQTIFDKKGFNILVLDVHKFSTLTHYFVIAEGNIDRHVQSLALAVRLKMKELNELPLATEGESTGDWIVLDYGDIVVHLFIPELREHYALEELWREAKIVDVDIKITDQS